MATLSHQKIVNTSCLIAVAGMLTMPDAVFGLLLEISHLILELVHFLFEIIESALDHLVEHIFHTETRETQIIVFYLMMAIGLAAIYYLCRSIRWVFIKLNEIVRAVFTDYKSRVQYYWAESAANKFKLVAGFNVVLTFAYLVGF
jgi:hypothetical protein